MTNGTAPNQILTEDSLDISPRLDSEPQSLMGVRFACNTLENAMPLIIQEVHFEGLLSVLALLGSCSSLAMLRAISALMNFSLFHHFCVHFFPCSNLL